LKYKLRATTGDHKKLISSKKESQDFLMRSGIHNKKGELSQNYIHTK
jgi:hypothetical protein